MKVYIRFVFVGLTIIALGCERHSSANRHSGHDHSKGDGHDHSHDHDGHEHDPKDPHDHGPPNHPHSDGESDPGGSSHGAQHNHGDEEAGRIAFTAAQQTDIEFGLFEVAKKTIHRSIPAYGTIRARSDGEAIVTAPLAGRILTAGKAFPKVGDNVKKEQLLVSLAPRLADSADSATLDLDVERAELSLQQAEIDHTRLAELFQSGAVAESRVIAAKSEVSNSQADLRAAKKRLAQHRRLSRTGGAVRGGIQIRSPIHGTLTKVEDVRPGIFTNEGQVLFHIDDLDRLWLEAQVTEVNIGRLGNPTSAWFEVDGFEKPFHIEQGNLVAVGGVIDSQTRTTPVIFEMDNPDRRLRIGMSVKVYLKVGESKESLVVPRSAVLREEGRDIVMVQVGRELFERRPLKLGIRDSGFVEVLDGLNIGDKVVSKGTYAVKLAGSASAIPAHGHAH